MAREIAMAFNESCVTLQVLKEDVGRSRVPLDVLLPTLETHSSLSLLQTEPGASSAAAFKNTVMTYQTPPPLTPVPKPTPLPSSSPNRPPEGSITILSSSSRTSLTHVAHRASAPPSNCSLSLSSTQAPSPLALPALSLPPVPDHTPCNSLLFSYSELPSLSRSTSPPSTFPSTSDMPAQSSDSQDSQTMSRQKPHLMITIPA
ncbi:hypothetical protein AN958_08504 [Leucoagaricus sp. SymC.cos]|nr:hypothetical protein AN958_08504 [Leucoagaricus sp. SymC.cos]